jgi:hypothetical protein
VRPAGRRNFRFDWIDPPTPAVLAQGQGQKNARKRQ